MPIQILPSLVVKQIAAGECIERPASIVKELVENSLDAGATDIEIYVEDAGNRLIQVIDNGCGIAPAELELAITSHATSKLQAVEDLDTIETMGFRGEALASICSVAEVKIASAIAANTTGYVLQSRGEQLMPIRPVGMQTGTLIEVRNLFFNIPARRKFLKSKHVEMGHITDTIMRLALANFSVAFKLRHNDREILVAAAAANYQERITDVIGDKMQFITASDGKQDCQLHAYLTPPEHHRSNNKWQFLYLNRRWVKDRVTSKALADAYRDYLPAKKHPIAVLYLQMDPALVDVNVHPAKTEVRFRDSQAIYGLVYKTVLQALRGEDFTPEIVPTSFYQQQDLTGSPAPKADSFPTVDPAPENAGNSSQIQATDEVAVRPTMRGTNSPNEDIAGVAAIVKEPLPKEQIVPEQEETAPVSYLQVHRRYLLMETSQGITLIDQHALHERILYERLRRQLKRQKVISQKLLFAETLQLSALEMELFDKWHSQLADIGIEARAIAPTRIEITSIPQLLGKLCAPELVVELLEQLNHQEKVSLDTAVDHLLATMACKAAVKTGDDLTPQEIQSLLRFKSTTDNPFHCPHGRPTMVNITLQELDKYFDRR